MHATMEMPLDTVFGNRIQLTVDAELDNPHALSNRALISDMARMLRYMLEETRSENERAIDQLAGREGSARPSERAETHETHDRELARDLKDR